ncbi:hypothetical protein [Pseudonocardia parietis]|uniref:Uncharacterized protein n=1 Tax=Pseudonocardia parietis TaxID=570936 RepID=A0ABS4VUA0_9PSEU|nr:hypothetical protein [Pseudonocardia parietis]MBP2367119.1 hypothetical protein [Pseudonocardia parietis]
MSEWRLALSVPRWAARFFVRHWKPVVGLSLVGSIQRFVVVNWSGEIPDAVASASEVVVALARIALVVVVWRTAMRGVRLRWSTARGFVSRHPVSLAYQGLLLCAAFLLFDVAVERGGAALLPPAWGPTYLAVVLMVKNPTVIAFTVVWWVGLIRQLGGTARQPAAPTRRPGPA